MKADTIRWCFTHNDHAMLRQDVCVYNNWNSDDKPCDVVDALVVRKPINYEAAIKTDRFGQARKPYPPYYDELISYCNDAVDAGNFAEDAEKPSWARTVTDMLRILDGENVNDLIASVEYEFEMRASVGEDKT